MIFFTVQQDYLNLVIVSWTCAKRDKEDATVDKNSFKSTKSNVHAVFVELFRLRAVYSL